jgi:hypothetical protein
MNIQVIVSGGRLPDPTGVVDPLMDAAMTETVMLLERETKRRTPVGVTEALRGSIAGEVRYGQTADRGVLLGGVGTPMAYGAVVEHGRKPGGKMPPIDALELWVRRKVWMDGGDGGRRRPTVQQARGIAFAIARKIAREGTEGVHMFEEALRENEDKVRSIWNRVGMDIVLNYGRSAGGAELT